MEERRAKLVLIVDNDAAFSDEVEKALEATGYETDTESVADAALSSFRKRQHDAIVAAVELPEKNGFAFLEELRADALGRRTPVVLLTAVDLLKRRRKAGELKAAAFLIKPVDIAQLVAKVVEHTGGSQEPVRDGERFPHYETVEVRCEGWNHFVEMVTENVSRGGMFIATNNPPPVFTRVRVRIFPKDGNKTVTLLGEVRHIVSTERARTRNASPGMGIRFEDVSDDVRALVNGLIKRASNPKLEAVRPKTTVPPIEEPAVPEELSADDRKRLAVLKAELGRLKERDYFQRLDLSHDADERAVRAAFRERAREFHPDRYAAHPDEVRDLAQEIFLVLNEAKKKLRSAAVREQLRKAHAASAPASVPRRRTTTRRRDREDAARGEPDAGGEPKQPPAPIEREAPRAEPRRAQRSTRRGIGPSRAAAASKDGGAPSAEEVAGAVRRDTAMAMQALNHARYDDAVERLTSLIDRGVNNREVLVSLELAKGYGFRDRGDSERARRHFERACSIDTQCMRAIRALRTLDADSEEEDRGILSRLFR